MVDDAAAEMKARLRGDLRLAMKERRASDVGTLRVLIGAIDNAEAPDVATGSAGVVGDPLAPRSAEAERLTLGLADVQAVIASEAAAWDAAVIEFERLGRADVAVELRAQAALARHYLD